MPPPPTPADTNPGAVRALDPRLERAVEGLDGLAIAGAGRRSSGPRTAGRPATDVARADAACARAAVAGRVSLVERQRQHTAKRPRARRAGPGRALPGLAPTPRGDAARAAAVVSRIRI